MAWDDNEEYDDVEEDENEEEEEDYADDEDPHVPVARYEEIYDMRPIEEVKGWFVLNEIIITNNEDEKLPKKKSIIKKESSIVFDLQNLDVPGDRNGAKKVR